MTDDSSHNSSTPSPTHISLKQLLEDGILMAPLTILIAECQIFSKMVGQRLIMQISMKLEASEKRDNDDVERVSVVVIYSESKNSCCLYDWTG